MLTTLKRYVVPLTLICLFAALGMTVSVLRWADRRIPSPYRLTDIRPALKTTVFDRHGDVIHEFYRENRVLVPLERIPESLVDAVLSTEDRKFYQHWGVDLAGIARAAVENLRAGKLRQGGSTITQQLARGMFLTHERTWNRKILDAVLAVRIEHMYSKDEILAMYLNQVYFGEGVYGAQAAAHHFFGKDIAELAIEESALLAGIPNNPSIFNPHKSLESARSRRDHVLRAMLDTRTISHEEYDAAVTAPIVLIEQTNAASVGPYFVELVRRHLQARYGTDLLYEGGLQVYTTLDLPLQRKAEAVVEEHLLKLEGLIEPVQTRAQFQEAKLEQTTVSEQALRPKYLQGALLAMDARSGYVYSLVGGRDFKESAFNRAVQARRQPGSAFKPFIYTAAIDNGFRASDIVLDTPVVFQGKDEEDEWRPKNYNETFLGPMTLRFALKKSINIPAIKVLRKVGVSTAASYAHRMGIDSKIENVLSVALGTSEVTLLELTRAYTPFANEGIRAEPLSVLRVEDRNGEILEINTPKQEEVLSKETTAILTSMLADVIDSGTAAGTRWRGFHPPAGGKTGTTDNYTDGWFLGFTPDLVCGVWVGYDSAIPIGERMEGSRVALPIWTQYMIEATRDARAIDFPRPDTIVTMQVCSDSGQPVRDACPSPYDELYKRGTEPQKLCSFPHEEQASEQVDPTQHRLRDLDRLDQNEVERDQLRLE